MSSKFMAKKFRSDKDYRAAVVEAVRIVQSFGVAFPEYVMELIGSCKLVHERS